MTRARSLSRLANTNAFTVDASNNVGIGSTQPDVRLDVDGDMNVSGTLTYEDVTNVETAGITTTGGLVVTGLGATIGGITTFFGDINFGAAGVGGTITTLGHAEFAGVVTATSFSGDGSGLTGVASTDNINTSTLAQFTGGVGIADSIFHIGDDNTAIRFPGNDTFTVETSGSEALRIDGSQRLLMGRTSTAAAAGRNSNIQLHSNDASEASITIRRFYVNTDDNAPPRLVLSRSGSNSDDFTIVANNNRLGEITFAGADGTDARTEAANIRAEVDGTPGSNDMPGRLIFSTTADGASDYTERLRITAAGRVRHQNSGGETIFEMRRTDSNTSGSVGTINFTASDGASVASIGAVGDGDNEGAHIVFRTTSAAADNSPFNAATPERVRIDSSGNVHIGDSSSNANGHGLLSLTQNAQAAFNALVIQQGNTLFTATDGLHIGIDASVDAYIKTFENRDIYFTTGTTNTEKLRINNDGSIVPGSDNSQDLGSTSLRWANIYSADLQLSNEGSVNDVDGTWGQYTIQEGENDLFLLNRRNGKTYKFVLEEV